MNECFPFHSVILHWNNLNYLLHPQLQNIIYYLSFWPLLFFLFGIFPPFSSQPLILTSKSIFCLLPSLICPPKALALYLGSLRAFIASYLTLHLFMHVSWFSVKKCKLEIGKMPPCFGSMIPIFACLPRLWYPLRMFESLTLAFTHKWEVETYKYFTLFFSTYSPNPNYVLYNVNHWLTIEFSSIFCTLYIYDVVKFITGMGICWPNMMCF